MDLVVAIQVGVVLASLLFMHGMSVSVRRQGTILILSGVQPEPKTLFRRCGLEERLGTANVCPSFHKAMERARACSEG